MNDGLWWRPRGYRTWVCACGRLGLALALERCPGCGGARDAAPAPGEGATLTGAAEAAEPVTVAVVPLAAVRAWAVANNVPVSARGKIARSVHDAYAAAHQEGASHG